MTKPRLRFAPVGVCIYCGSKQGDVTLGDEHIIPYSLNGRAILPQASCANCATETCKVEGRLARGAFLPIRLLHKFRTRRPKERPSDLPLYDVGEAGDVLPNPEYVPIDTHPAIHTLPGFEQPGILVGAEPSAVFNNLKIHASWPLDISARLERMRVSGIKDKKYLGDFMLGDVVRLIAKVAHGIAVAHYGYGSFEPFLLDTIMGRDSPSAYFVGGAHGKLPEAGPTWHSANTSIQLIGKRALLVVRIHLFSCLSPAAPVYVVVAGEFPPHRFVSAT